MSDTSEWNKDRASVYIDLAKMAQGSFQDRRVYEWKIAFGLWTGIAALTYFVVSSKDRLSSFPTHYLGWIYVTFGAVWLAFWLIPLRRAFELDKRYKHYYMQRAEGSPASLELSKDRPAKVTTWEVVNPVGGLALWTYGQFLVTVLFLGSSYLLMSDALSTRSSDRILAPASPLPSEPPSTIPNPVPPASPVARFPIQRVDIYIANEKELLPLRRDTLT
jgi:hypothetical protein